MDLSKAVWTSNSVTIKSERVLKDKRGRSVGQELSSIYSSKIHSMFVNTLPITNQHFPNNFQTSSPSVFCLIPTKLGLK